MPTLFSHADIKKKENADEKTCICCVIDAGVLPDHLSSTRATLTNINQPEIVVNSTLGKDLLLSSEVGGKKTTTKNKTD